LIVLAAALVLATSLVLPHRLDLRRCAPRVALVVWGSALVLRAGLVFAVAVFVARYLPATELFASLTHWCWHTVLPGIATHLGLDGHAIGDVAILLPAAVLALSLVSVGHGIMRAARAVRDHVRRAALGPGPEGSLIVGDDGVLVAAAGITRPQLIISPLALTVLDDRELHASLGHERGHVVRRHRYVLLVAELLCALGRFVPGARRAVEQVRFHLERDADRWAVARGGDRLALASAICKAAQFAPRTTPALAALSGGAVVDRVTELMEDGRPERRGWRPLLLATWLSVVALAVVVALPAAALSSSGPATTLVHHCED